MVLPEGQIKNGASRRAQRALWVWYVPLLVLAMLLPATQVLERAELWLLDVNFHVLRKLGPGVTPDDIVLVGIDEASEKAIAQPLGLWHEAIGQVLTNIALARPRAIGLDIVLPERSAESLRPGMDAALMRGLVRARKSAPLAISTGIEATGRVRPIFEAYIVAAGADAPGLAYMPRDLDGKVRRQKIALADGQIVAPTFFGRLAAGLGVEATDNAYIDFSRGNPFHYLPILKVLEADRATLDALTGKVVLIGSVLPFIDRAAQPLNLAEWEAENPEPPAVLIQAQALRAELSGGPVRRLHFFWLFMCAPFASAVWWVRGRGAALAIAAAGAVALYALSLMALREHWFFPVVALLATLLAGWAARTAYEAWHQARERERLQRTFAGYVSPGVLHAILSGELDAQHATRHAMLCFLFADIRGFTARSETEDPELTFALLNRYYEAMINVLHRHGGTIDNFRGDGLMAIFGAPQALSQPQRSAWLSAQGILEAVRELNVKLKNEGVAAIELGIGIASGSAVVGNIGSAERFDFTAIGDAANVASHLRDVSRGLGYSVLLGENVALSSGCDDLIDAGMVTIPGHAPVRAWGWRGATRTL
jgi:class 3 adenylate cyclase